MVTDDSTYQYSIPQVVLEKYPDIVEMLKKSKSIDPEEKQYWFGALETMDADQVASLASILSDEQSEIDHQKEIEQAVAEKGLEHAEAISMEAKRIKEEKARKKRETDSEKEEEAQEEKLLSILDEI